MIPRSSLNRIAVSIAAFAVLFTALPTAHGVFCILPDSGGTAGLPPVGCVYTTPLGDLHIIDGLPPGTTIDIDGEMSNFMAIVVTNGGTLGGQMEQYTASLLMPMVGTGSLAGFNRIIAMPLQNESHSAPRMLGAPVQSFNTVMFQTFGQITGDPDFDLLRITAGNNFGLPSPGHTTLTQLGPPGSNWNVDSFFDITYRIDFVGAPGGTLAGRSGSTTGTVRLQAGMVPEPMSAMLAAGSALVLAEFRRRQRRADRCA